VEFEVGQHMWLNIKDLKMSDGLAPCFPTKYVRLYEIVAKLHFDVYTLKLLTGFVAHMTICVSKLKLFMRDENRSY
jgi:hypothetical protein